MKNKKWFLVLFVLIFFLANLIFVENQKEDELIDTMALEWDNEVWINSEQLKFSNLRGKVILIRWWTETCPLCEHSAPALNEFYQEYSEDLVIIGMYHPKPFGTERSVGEVQQFADNWNMKFPITLDTDWKTLNLYWLYKKRDFTSISFLIDKEGFIRYIHPGGEYPVGSDDYYELKEKIEGLI